MKITDTLKQIIEKVEPYMDKTLSEGCLLEYSIVDSTDITESGDYRRYDWLIKEYDWLIKEYNKILWHYDITAVLKYISKINWHFYSEIISTYHTWTKERKDIFRVLNTRKDILWEYPNKPLHLYTEEENLQLLNLLNKLRNEK